MGRATALREARAASSWFPTFLSGLISFARSGMRTSLRRLAMERSGQALDRGTDEGEIASVTPSRISVRASSLQSQVESDRSHRSGSSHASLIRYVATIGGKTRGTPAARSIVQAAET